MVASLAGLAELGADDPAAGGVDYDVVAALVRGTLQAREHLDFVEFAAGKVGSRIRDSGLIVGPARFAGYLCDSVGLRVTLGEAEVRRCVDEGQRRG